MDYRDNRQRWAESHQVVHFYAGQWCTFTPALTYSLADLAYAPYMTRLDRLSLIELVEDYPNVMAWYGRLKSRPAYDAAIVQWDDPHYVGTMKENGEKLRADVRKIFDQL